MKKRQRLYFVLFVLSALSGAVALSLYALQDNVSFFYSPRDVVAMQQSADARVMPGRSFRLGGLVVNNSIQRQAGSNLAMTFSVTDGDATVVVSYEGIPPDLFREGQGIVAKGALDAAGVFEAEELLAKHDENYMPPEVAKSLRKEYSAP